MSSAAHKGREREEGRKEKRQRKSVRKWQVVDMGGEEEEGRKRGGELNIERENRERDELSWMLFMVKLYQSPPSEVPCDQCVLSVLCGSVLYLEE